MKQQPQTSKTLDSFCQNQPPLLVKTALLTIFKVRFSRWSEIVILSLEYLQLISQAYIVQANLYDSSDMDNYHFLTQVIHGFFKLIDLSSLLSFERHDSITPIILLLIFALTVLKYILFLYIIHTAFRNHAGNSLLVSLWRWVCRCQGRILYFLTTSLWVRAIINNPTKDSSMLRISDLALTIVSSLMIVTESLFSFFTETQFCYILPTKNFLSSKNYQTQLLTLTQKLTLQVVVLASRSNTLTALWIFSTFNLLVSAFRCSQYYRLLPVYNFQALLYNGYLLDIVLSFSLACFISTLLSTVGYDQTTDMNFIVYIWIIISVLTMKISHGFLQQTMVRLLTSPIENSPELCVHKIFATKQLIRTYQSPCKNSDKCQLAYLLRVTQKLNIRKVFHQKRQPSLQNAANGDDEDMNEVFREYLEVLSNKFSQNSLIKLLLAQVYIRKVKLYSKAISIIAKLNRKERSWINLSSSLLLYKAERKILTAHHHHYSHQYSIESTLDIDTYIQSKIFLDRLREKMIAQADLKIGVCKNILGDTADLGEIFDSAQLVHKSKLDIQKTIDSPPNFVPDYFLQPLLLSCEYYRVLDYDWKQYKKYRELYLKRYDKYQKYFRNMHLQNKNLYQPNNAFLVLSGHSKDCGRILFATKSIYTLYGSKDEADNKSHIASLFTPSLQSYYSNYFRSIVDRGQESAMKDSIIKAYLQHKDKHMIEVEIFIGVHHYITQGLYLNVLIRPVPSTQEYLLVKENGDIESTTEKIGGVLGIPGYEYSKSSPLNVKVLSPELAGMNEAFNIINMAVPNEQTSDLINQKQTSEKKPELLVDKQAKYSTFERSSKTMETSLDFIKARELCNLYATQGKQIEISPVYAKSYSKHTPSDKHSYHCKIRVIQYGLIAMKLFMIEPIKDIQKRVYDGSLGSQQRKTISNDVQTINSENIIDGDEFGMIH